MKIRAIFESQPGTTSVELVPENDGERQLLKLMDDKSEAKVEAVYDSPNQQHRKLVLLRFTVGG